MTGRLALRMPPRGSKTESIPRGTPDPGGGVSGGGGDGGEGGLQVKSVEPWATTMDIRTELMMQVLG